ncbi:MAG: DUF3153 domain-containing protein [Synechococcaceae cyanobacterium]|nr:DUF3153 domain-containing protein [Synechococcaceae cyanobacterium]
MVAEALAMARSALERGEYGTVRRLLEPIAETHGPATAIGAGVRLLLVTALMGQGQSDQAAACCRTLLSSRDAALRARARELLEVLEAPALRRPRNWSLTLPDLSGSGALEGVARRQRSGRREAPPAPPPPPVGPTRAPLGFAALAVVVLVGLLLATLLGGCMQVRTDLEFAGPGRLQLSHHLRSASGRLTPWQRRFGEALGERGFESRGGGAVQVLRTPVLPAAAALEALTGSVAAAASAGDLPAPPVAARLEERNWLVGVRQHLVLDLDLSRLPAMAGLDLSLRLAPLAPQAVLRAEPRPVEVDPPQHGAGHRTLRWRLTPGRRNRLDVRCWRWSPLGLGGLLVGLVLVLVLALQRMRQRLGFGPAQLPS